MSPVGAIFVRSLPKRGHICYIPALPQSLNGSIPGDAQKVYLVCSDFSLNNQPLGPGVYKSSYTTICIISIKTVYATYCIYLTATFIKLNSTLSTVHLDQENSFLDLL